MAGERILVVDDEPGVRSALEGILSDEGFVVCCVESGEAGLETLEREPFDAVLLDVWLPGIDGVETLTRLRERHTDTQVVMISGHGTIETAVRATKRGAFDFIEKPLSLERTLLVLRNALRQKRLESANRQLLAQLARDTEIIGQSAATQALRRQIEVAAGTDAPVLISGPQGSGRETVARRIHNLSRKSEAAFVEVPCGALDATSATTALFGGDGQTGRIDLARGGSLFLEDVDQLPGPLQQRLASELSLRDQQGKAPRVLASVAEQPSNLDSGLRQRLEVVLIPVPGLRQRREDVPLLAARFMGEFSREYGRASKRLTAACLAALTTYDWPGEVRELRNLMERLLLFVPDEVVDVADLPEALGRGAEPGRDLYGHFRTLREGLQAFERYYIRRILAEVDEDPVRAAARLGLSAASLQKRLKSL